MKPFFVDILNNPQRYESFVSRLQMIFSQMDQQYGIVADQYGFHCRGCKDNCCHTQFYHHTLLECLYLTIGYRNLVADIRQEIAQHARFVHKKHIEAARRGVLAHEMCPLNRDNLCVLYHYRPMICRLHGIPYELHQPGQSVTRGSGCNRFDEQCGAKSYIVFNRTPFYSAIAGLEKKIRAAIHFTQKIKLSVAQILTTISSSDF